MRYLSEVMTRLTPGTAPKEYEAGRSALACVPSNPVGYVPPRVRDLHLDGTSRVLLVEAAGAVGKSAAAAWIAANRGWLYIDSSRLQVGNFGLSGLLNREFPSGDFFDQLRSGRFGLVVDSLDEAHLKAGTPNFYAFLDDLAELANSIGSSGIGIVVMARPDTGRHVKDYLNGRVGYGSCELDFFDLSAAKSYISSYLEHYSSAEARQFFVNKNEGGYSALRDARMKAVAEVLLGEEIAALEPIWDDIAQFLGYAPVLAVLAETIPSDNPFRDAVSASGKDTASQVLLVLMDALLGREQAKFISNVGPRLVSKVAATTNFSEGHLYSPEDQLYRLACASYPDQGMVERRVVPDIIWPDYDESATQWIADHPFGGSGSGAVNTVFADYVSAASALDPTSSSPRTSDPGPFFYRFVFALCGPEDSLAERVIPPLIRSALKATTRSHIAWFISQRDGMADIDIFDSYSDDFISRSISDLSGMIELASPLSLGLIVTDEAVSISGESGTANLGPKLTISARYLTLDVDSLSTSHGDVYLIAEEVDAPRLRAVNVYDPAKFYVLGGGGEVWPHLRQYASPAGHWEGRNFVDFSSYVDLRAVLRGFSRQAAGALSIYVEKLDQGIVKQSPRRIHMLKRLMELSVVEVKGKHYVLNVERFAEYGVSLPSLVGGEPDAAVMKLIRILEVGLGQDR